jgi:hypothetical protein
MRKADKQTGGQEDGWTLRQEDRQTGGHEDGWTGVKHTGIQEDRKMAGQAKSRQAYRRTGRWLDRRKADRHTGGQEDGWTCVKQTGIQEDRKMAGHA